MEHASGQLPGLRYASKDIGRDTGDLVEQVESLYAERENIRRSSSAGPGALPEVFNATGMLSDAAAALVDDSFFRCFQSLPPDPWNWNAYLFPLWCLGLILRYFVFFPLRLLFLIASQTLFFAAFFPLQMLMKDTPRRRELERALVRLSASGWVASWMGVIKYHGPRPAPAPNRVWVANHTSMIDYTILTAYMPFAAIMQLQPGWVGFLQTRVLNCLGCLWFNRTEVKDRAFVARRMQEHVRDPQSTPLLVFPEGTCVNNDYTVMFKRGAFDLGATVCPIAIKYNKIFVDAFWNSRRQAFTTYIFKLMTSWALVADVYFLPPQTKRDDESAVEFAERVQRMIAEVAELRIVPWDGYLKYYSLADKRPQLLEARRRTIAERFRGHLPPDLQGTDDS